MPSTITTRSTSSQPLKSLRQHKAPDPDEIAIRAYELYKSRGEIHGHDLEDWFEAELQLIRERDLPVTRV